MTRYREAFSWTRGVDDFLAVVVTETPLLHGIHTPILLARYERSRQTALFDG